MRPKVVALYGYAGSGKDTAAKYFVEQGMAHKKVATPIKQVACELFDWSPDIFEDRVLKEKIDDRWKIAPRDGAKFVGYEMVQHLCKVFPEFEKAVGMDFFGVKIAADVAAWAESGRASSGLVISDVRFPPEIKCLRNLALEGKIDFFLVEVFNRRVEEEANLATKNKATHPSETHFGEYIPDIFLDNNGSFENLREGVATIIRDLYRVDGRKG